MVGRDFVWEKKLEMCPWDTDAPAIAKKIRINRALTLSKDHNSDYNRCI